MKKDKNSILLLPVLRLL